MKKYNKILILNAFILAFFFSNCTGQNKVVECSSPDSVLVNIKAGNTASMLKTAYIKEFSLIEESKIVVAPPVSPETQYSVQLSITDIYKGKNTDSYSHNSVLGFITKRCKSMNVSYGSFKNTSCFIKVDTPEDAAEVAVKGINEYIDNKYLITGSLVDVYNEQCRGGNTEPQVDKKPAVYLYPEKNMNVTVKLKINGRLLDTEPLYSRGWNVNVTPDGLIDNKYDYLFYEAYLNKIELPDKGWVVAYTELEKWFDEMLPELGLNSKECSQFKEFWLKDLKKSDYYEIRMLDEKFLTENMELIINPKPETLIRLNFYFKPLSSKIDIQAPVINKIKRKGFTVVEWGGLNDGNLKNVLPN